MNHQKLIICLTVAVVAGGVIWWDRDHLSFLMSETSFGRALGIRPTSRAAVAQRPMPKYEVTREIKTTIPKKDADEAAADPQTLLLSARLRPDLSPTKEFNGFKLTRVEKGSLLGRMGFESGDILRSVNGVGLNDPARGQQAFQSMKGKTSGDLVLSRGTENILMRWSIQ